MRRQTMMKNLLGLLALLLIPSLALMGCASTEKTKEQNHFWQSDEHDEKGKKKKKHKHKHKHGEKCEEHEEHDEYDDHDEREERMEREIFRDK